MHIVGRIRLPKSVEVSNLYINCDRGAAINYSDSPAIFFDRGGIVSSNTYFNSFYENFYAKYTNLDSLSYRLRLEGDFQISVYREFSGQESRELIVSEKLENCQATGFVKIELTSLVQSNNQGRIYFELLCESEKGTFHEGLIATEQKQIQPVSLAIISCTYKKETYIKNTVNNIVRDELLKTKEWKVFVVDNGKTLSKEDFKDPRVQLISNRNMGGSGGFTRGLVEALQSENYSHFLFMDDDIELDSESIYRLFALYEYARSDFAIAGSMLDLYEKQVLYEAGTRYGEANKNSIELKPFSIVRVKHNLKLENPTSLNSLLLDEEINFGSFYFFAFSKEVVKSVGLPLPLFIKGDDLEFGLRIKKALDGKLVAFPSIAVWHEPFHTKFPIWDKYYYVRNSLITQAIHGVLGYINAVSHISKDLILYLLLFEYNYAEMLVKAFEDYVKGPSILKDRDPELLHKEILALSKSFETQSIKQNYCPPKQVKLVKSQAGIGDKLISLLTLNGHLLPNFITNDGEVFLWQTFDYAGVRSRAFRKKRVLIFQQENNCLYQNDIDKLVGIKLLFRWIKVVASSRIKWSSLVTDWKEASSELTSTMFWQQYLGTEESNSNQVEPETKNLLTK